MEFIITIQDHLKEYRKGVDDCYSLAREIYLENGIELPEYIDVRSAKKRDDFKGFLIDNVEYEEVVNIERGAFILFKTNPWHCGIAVDTKKMIHRLEGMDTRIERVSNYGQEIAGIYMVKKVST